MKIGIIGRSDALFKSMVMLNDKVEIKFIITAKEAPEYNYGIKEFESFANQHSIPILVCNKLETEEVDQLLRDVGKVDIVISCNFTFVIKQSFINNFPLGVLNIHGGDIPRYRGNACQAWAILNGESKIGLSVYRMEGDKLDVGEVIVEEFYDTDPDTRIGEVMNWINETGPNIFFKAIKKIEENPSFILRIATEEDPNGFRCFPRQPSDGIIDWKNDSESIVRLVNASSEPYAGAFTYFNSKKLIIWRASRVVLSYKYLAVPGQIMEIHKSFIIVATGAGAIKIESVSFEDKVIFSPSVAIKTIRARLG
jgi:UDP-4-amino-4-deoxy-L-arabinose formyltransferase/UDP-glucuronic acid dehydrogenase (UDP-4-keto-hexauronic acid decarboxylating)